MSPAGQGAPVTTESQITDQYASLGIAMEGVALVDLQSANPSGINSISGFDVSNMVDYGAPMTFRFVTPAHGDEAMTDYFAITTDTVGFSGNVVVVSAFDAAGSLVGSVSYEETGSNGHRIVLEGIGPFHRVVVAPTLSNPQSGGIGFDLLEFGSIAAVTDSRTWLPSNVAILRCEEGLAKATAKLSGGIYNCHRRRVSAAVKGRPFDREACENSARDKFDQSAARLFASGTCPQCAVTNAPGSADRVQATLGDDIGLLYCDGTVPLP